MSKELEQIRRKLRELCKSPEITIPGKVVSVDKAKVLCTVAFDEAGDVTEDEVRLRAVSGTTGMIVYPATNSQVLVSCVMNQPENLFVSMYSEIEGLSGDIGGQKLAWNKDGFVFNDGSLGGLVLAKELKTQLDKLTARVDGIMNAIKSAAVVAGDGGATFKTNMITVLNTLTSKESFESLENSKIKQ